MNYSNYFAKFYKKDKNLKNIDKKNIKNDESTNIMI